MRSEKGRSIYKEEYIHLFFYIFNIRLLLLFYNKYCTVISDRILINLVLIEEALSRVYFHIITYVHAPQEKTKTNETKVEPNYQIFFRPLFVFQKMSTKYLIPTKTLKC